MVSTRDYFGHAENVRALSKALPAVSLFVGPKSVGKWELAEWLRDLHGVRYGDVLRIKRLTQENAKFVARWSLGAPQGDYRLVICRLEKTTPVAMNTLLKTLEESKSTRFILVSETMPLDTIRSRAEVFEFGLLTEENVAGILTATRGMKPDVAEKRAATAAGRVRNALEYGDKQDAKAFVLTALEAVATKNAFTLETVAQTWQQEYTDLLVAWCYESITGKWSLFKEDDTHIRGTALPLRILMALKEDLRPRLVVRAALASLI